MRNTVDILGIPVDSVTMQQAVDKVAGFLEGSRAHTVYTPNAEIMMAAQRDTGLKKILVNADLLIADGAGVVLASKLLRRAVPEKVSGIDLVRKIFTESANNKIKCFLFGSKPGIAETAAEKIMEQYPGVGIAGCIDGYFTQAEEESIIERINASGSDILLVALGAPRQEKWISKYKDSLKVKVCMGVGGTLDVLAGKVELAPEIFRKNGFEWLFRLYKEPRRAKRMLDLPRFVMRVLWARMFERS
jgi:N-acetylglucosaminyldiphosphoundecaprenol N-acetyl-beta-D-mannosaminyltransferase